MSEADSPNRVARPPGRRGESGRLDRFLLRIVDVSMAGCVFIVPLLMGGRQALGQLALVFFAVVAALAWNGAIQAIFKEVFGTAEGIVPMLVYAVVVTIIAIIVTVQIGKAAAKSKTQE